jgi:MFS family permease
MPTSSPLWSRQLPHYPANGARYGYLGVVVLVAVCQYWALYTIGAVAPLVTAELHISFPYLVGISVVGGVCGAFASVAAGLADRWGRANLVAYGTLLTGGITAFWMSHPGSKAGLTAAFAVLSAVEGVVLVATPALIRDFSPQVGRGTAMAFWTLGPLLGSIVVATLGTHMLDTHSWQSQYYIAGTASILAAFVAIAFLRELSPALRDQLMVELKDRALIEAKAATVDPEQLLEHHWRRLLKLDVLGSAVGVSLLLFVYFTTLLLGVVYFATTYGYSESRANGLMNWWWIPAVITILTAGFVSDAIKVRKPFMFAGGAFMAAGTLRLALNSTNPHTTHTALATTMLLLGVGMGLAYAPWMASFTETVENHNPAATATGLAMWGWTIRAAVAICGIATATIVSAATPLVDQGPRVQQLATKYQAELATAAKIDPSTQQALAANPNDTTAQVTALSEVSGLTASDAARAASIGQRYAGELATAATLTPSTQAALVAKPGDQATLATAVTEIATGLKISPADAADKLAELAKVPPADLAFMATNGPAVKSAVARLTALGAVPAADLAYLRQHGPKVAQALADAPKQWRTWWWVCFAAALAFIPAIFVMAGHWSPRRARAELAEHERQVAQELAELNSRVIVRT